MSLRDRVGEAADVLAEAGIASAQREAVLLAAHVLGAPVGEVQRAMILGDDLDADARERYAALVAERAQRIPLQHLTGRATFRHLELAVGPGVFIPRPETEMVAGLAITAAQEGVARSGGVNVVDLCTGSGAIALAIKDEVPAARVYAVELSPEAHAWAEHNARLLGLEVKVRFGDATTAFPELEGDVDVVVSNPPYIPVGMVPIYPEVRDHDPEIALYGGSDNGLAIPLAVAARAASLLRPDGVLIMEHADTQGQTLPNALMASGLWHSVNDHLDLTRRPRATTARRTATG